MYLLDTDTLVLLLRGRKPVVEKFEAHLQHPRAISVISYGELLYGALKSARSLENAAKVRHLGNLMPVIEVSPTIIETYAALKADLEKQGNKIDEFDLIIAATALERGSAVATFNVRHFSAVKGLKVIEPK